MISSCNELTQHKNIPVSENKRVFRVINQFKKYVNKVTVDGCYMTNGAKCDYLFEILEKEQIQNVFYVELKGSDIPHAIEQLEATIYHCKSSHKEYKKESYVVASKVPKAGVSSQVLKKKFLAKNNIQLFIDTNIKEVDV